MAEKAVKEMPQKNNTAPEVSIVIPVFNEEDCLERLFNDLMASVKTLGRTYEIVLVNDGSQDKSEKMLNDFQAKHSDVVRIIHLNGNFGQHNAIIAAFENVRGETIVTLDADLQNPPSEIKKLLDKMDEGFDVVGGVREKRQDRVYRRWLSRLNNYIRTKVTNIKMSDQGCMLRAYKRNITDIIVCQGTLNTYIPAQANRYASNPTEVFVKHEERQGGESKYNFYRLMRLNFDLLTGTSILPLQLFTFFGLFVSFFTSILVGVLIFRRLFMGAEAEGIFTLFAILFFLVGVVITGIGIVGEYVGRTYLASSSGPRYVVREILEKKGKN